MCALVLKSGDRLRGPIQLILVLISLVIVVSVGCSTVRDSDMADGRLSKFKSIQGISKVVFFWKASKARPIPILTLYDGSSPVINLVPYTKYFYKCSPGKHIFKLFSIKQKLCDFMIADLAPERTYFVELFALYHEKQVGKVSGISSAATFGSGNLIGSLGGFSGTITSSNMMVKLIPRDLKSESLNLVLKSTAYCSDRSEEDPIEPWVEKWRGEIHFLDLEAKRIFSELDPGLRNRMDYDYGMKLTKTELDPFIRMHSKASDD